MRKYQSINPSLSIIERPPCPTCDQARMTLSTIEPGPLGFDHRTFECPKCGSVRTMIISSDPTESDLRGWLAGDLRSPR
jgi:Zn finger protein HypA/HybF involved in hydrogenase expression